MPKYGIHGIVLDYAEKKLAQGNEADVRLSQIIRDNISFANMGAIGPDIFFWAEDYEIVQIFKTLVNNIEAFVAEYNKVMTPIHTIEDGARGFADEIVGNLTPATYDIIDTAVNQLRNAVSDFQSVLINTLFVGVLGGVDSISSLTQMPSATTALFNLFIPPMQGQMESRNNQDVNNWYWFDMLHYRKTGKFAENLVNEAGENGKQKAFAYGYLSHIATDVVGHSFINQVVSSPYRLNVQRHATAENFMDTWSYDRLLQGASVSKDLFEKMPLPDPDDVPDGVWQMLESTFQNTYENDHPTLLDGSGFLSVDQIKDAYVQFHKMLVAMKNMIVDRPEEPFDNVEEILAQALEDLFEAPPRPPSPPTEVCGWEEIFSFGLTDESSECYDEFFNNVAAWMEYFGELILWTFETIMDIIDLILAALASLPVLVLLALIYLIQLMLYDIYQEMRYILALYGLVSPEPSDINNSIGINLTTTALSCTTKFRFPIPRQNTRSHLVCPRGHFEAPGTAAGNHPNSQEENPVSFIGSSGTNTNIDYDNLKKYAESTGPEFTRSLQQQNKNIGTASDFAAWMIKNSKNETEKNIVYTDWNLDADRGYCYKAWDGKYINDFTIDEEDNYVS